LRMPHDAQWDDLCGVFIELLTLPEMLIYQGSFVKMVLTLFTFPHILMLASSKRTITMPSCLFYPMQKFKIIDR
ncbi:hypothetical protein, partial [Geobacillus stearothermophilus]|uniref:hypothetical protein n=1 Tax=Geobacillus stearothermophilus TaxID=1422 RepID=UPI001F2050A2